MVHTKIFNSCCVHLGKINKHINELFKKLPMLLILKHTFQFGATHPNNMDNFVSSNQYFN